MSYSIEELSDRLEITELLYRYATALDSRQPELLEQVFAPEAKFVIGAGVGDFVGPKAIGELVMQFLGGLEASQHIITNPVIDLDGDRASSKCYLHAQHYLPDQRTGGNTLEIGGTYHDSLVRTEQGWRIESRELEVTWTEGNHGVQIESRARMAGESTSV